MYLITGFNVLKPKPHGNAGIVHFKPEDQFETDKLPTEDELRKYAEAHGYKVMLPPRDAEIIQDQAAPVCEPIFTYDDPQPKMTFGRNPFKGLGK